MLAKPTDYSLGCRRSKAPFAAFTAYRRGRPVEPSTAAPLDVAQVETLVLQIASNFAEQSGAEVHGQCMARSSGDQGVSCFMESSRRAMED